MEKVRANATTECVQLVIGQDVEEQRNFIRVDDAREHQRDTVHTVASNQIDRIDQLLRLQRTSIRTGRPVDY